MIPQDTTNRPALRPACPSSGSKGKPVEPVTIRSLVKHESRARVARLDGFRFCADPSCDIAYFHPETGDRFLKEDVVVRIGEKEASSPRPICYCFDHSVEELEAEVARTGTSRVADEVTEMCRQGLDRCEETNPQGSCCLGNVRRVVKEAQARIEGPPAGMASSVAGAHADAVSADCCPVAAVEDPPADGRSRNLSVWASGGAVLTAVFASACCWLPLLLIGFGASAAGVSGFFEAYRPYLLGATALLLGGGFFLVYFRKERCEPGNSCAAPNPRLLRWNKGMLWVATLVVLLAALFPSYVGAFLGGREDSKKASREVRGKSRLYAIEGMTCEACAVTLAVGLEELPGVADVEVSFEEKTARIYAHQGEALPTDEVVLRKIVEIGYRGVAPGDGGSDMSGREER
ncbi:MAG: mercuric transporter MerT family protein [Planctomycetota bacterium]|nr:mercuric transporter MerT family protein [Planctomycetota bacterium]